MSRAKLKYEVTWGNQADNVEVTLNSDGLSIHVTHDGERERGVLFNEEQLRLLHKLICIWDSETQI